MSLSEYFPALEQKGYVTLYNFTITGAAPKVIPAGAKNVSVLPSVLFHSHGLAVSFLIGTDNPLITVTFTIDDRTISGTMQDLKVQSLRGIPKLPFVVSYNPTFNLYVAVLEAEVPFSDNMFASVSNPTSTDMSIILFDAQIYLYNKGFYSALAKLKSGNQAAIVNDYMLNTLEDITINNNRKTVVI
jgi:hypothetical protein